MYRMDFHIHTCIGNGITIYLYTVDTENAQNMKYYVFRMHNYRVRTNRVT